MEKLEQMYEVLHKYQAAWEYAERKRMWEDAVKYSQAVVQILTDIEALVA